MWLPGHKTERGPGVSGGKSWPAVLEAGVPMQCLVLDPSCCLALLLHRFWDIADVVLVKNVFITRVSSKSRTLLCDLKHSVVIQQTAAALAAIDSLRLTADCCDPS
jgi:hypothetical protein